LICPRCACDLTLVRRAEGQTRQLTVRALHAWARGDREKAMSLARSALGLAHNPLARSVLKSLERENLRVAHDAKDREMSVGIRSEAAITVLANQRDEPAR
jgi:hypothetical protein